MELLLKLSAFAIVGSLLTLFLKKPQPELSFSLSILAVVFVLVLGIGMITTVIRLMQTIADQAGIMREVLEPLLKVLVITILSKITVDLCRESGSLALSTGIELIGNAVAIIAAAPLVLSMLKFLASI